MLVMQLGYALLYFLLGYTIHVYIPNNDIISLFWPSSGLALAVLLIYGKRYLWSVLLGSLTVGIAAQQTPVASIGIALANTLEAWLGYWLLTERAHFDRRMKTLNDYLKLMLIGGGLSSMVGTLVAICALLLGGNISSEVWLSALTHRWMGHVLGIALMASFVLSWQDHSRICKSRLEGAALFFFTLLIGQVIFLGWLHDSLGLIARGYWAFLCVTVIAIRMGIRGVTTIVLLLAMQALVGALKGIGFFADDIDKTGLQNYWFFMLICSIVGLSIATYISDIKRALSVLKQMELNERTSRDLLDQMAAISHTGGWQLTLPEQHLTWTREVYNIHELDPNSAPVLEQAINFYPSEARPIISAALENTLRDGTPWDLELPFITAKGKRIWVRAIGQALRVEGKTVQINGVFQDITASKQAKEALLQANADLEGFSYSVSHDLRTPLRAIDGFSNILLEDYADKLDAEGRRLLNVIRDNTVRMSTLIDDILNFSRAGRVELRTEPVDMDALAHRVLAELDNIPPHHALASDIATLPSVYGDAALLHQVWENLLSNAIKFSAKQAHPHLRIEVKSALGETIFSVHDNGVGFDMKYADKLFGVFQRLHGIHEFPGTGIGLAIAKRIVNRHGGRMWAEGKLGQGATFYFSIPDKELHHE